MQPRISVLMPTYNDARYLPEAIESILSQTYADFEFIIVDDCSTDETPAILSHYAQNDGRIRILRNDQNLGRAKSRNRLLHAHPRGEFIAVMDSDDVSLPQRFEKELSFLESHPHVVVVGAQVLNVDELNDPTPEQTQLPETHGSLAWSLLYGVPFCNPTVMMRLNAVCIPGEYQEDSAVEDAEFWSRLVFVGRFANLADTLLLYRMPSSRRILRMADWTVPLLEVTRLFVEKLLKVPVDTEMSYRLHCSLYHDPNLCLSADETLQTFGLLQAVFQAMQTKRLLQAEDREEVAELMLNQFRVLSSYAPES